jgi:hypothetical protein
MSNQLTLSDAINEAIDTGKDATVLYNGTLSTFSAAGLLAFILAEGAVDLGFTIPTSDPGVAGEVWNDEGVLKASAGA